jgi:hypothetical protein
MQIDVEARRIYIMQYPPNYSDWCVFVSRLRLLEWPPLGNIVAEEQTQFRGVTDD